MPAAALAPSCMACDPATDTSIDTAAAYGCEADVGEGIRDSGIPCDQLSCHNYLPSVEPSQPGRPQPALSDLPSSLAGPTVL